MIFLIDAGVSWLRVKVSLFLIVSMRKKYAAPMRAETRYGKRQVPVLAMSMLPSRGPVKAPTDQKT